MSKKKCFVVVFRYNLKHIIDGNHKCLYQIIKIKSEEKVD